VVIRNISQAKAELSALIEEVQKGNEVILAKAGKPIAKLIPYHGPAGPRMPGGMAGEIWIAPDFDSLPRDMAEAFGITEPQVRIPAKPITNSNLMAITIPRHADHYRSEATRACFMMRK